MVTTRPALHNEHNMVVRRPDGQWVEIDNESGQEVQAWTPKRPEIKVTIAGTKTAAFVVVPDERDGRHDDWYVGYADQPESWVAMRGVYFDGIRQGTVLDLVSRYLSSRRIMRDA